MKTLRTGCLLTLLAAAPACASAPIELNGADKPPCNAGNKGDAYTILDPLTDGDCVTGGGAANGHLCICDGTTWRPDYPDNHELVVVDASGNVGIGTTPAVNLHIVATAPTFRIESSAANSAFLEMKNTALTWQFGLVGATSALAAYDGTYLSFEVEAGSRDYMLHVDSTDRVGIGTASPQTILHVYEPTAATSYSRVECVAANCIAGLILKNDAYEWDVGVLGTVSDVFVIYDPLTGAVFTAEAGAPANSLYVDSTGRVGIGTNAPQANSNLAIVGTAAATSVELTADDGAGSIASWRVRANRSVGGMILQDVVANVAVATFLSGAPINSLYVNASGQVGLGTGSPNERLTVEGVLSLDETTAPTTTTGYGKVWTETDDELHFMDGGGVEHVLTASYAGISVEANATVTTITAVSTPAQITVFNTNSPALQLTPDHTTDDVTIDVTGDYFVIISSSVNSSGGTGSTIELTARKNNGASVLAGCRNDRTLAGGGGESGAITVSCIVNLAAADTVEAWAENLSNGDDVVFDDISLSVWRLDY